MSVDQISFITNLVREALQIERDAPPKLDKGKPDTFTLALPKLRISEQWGSPGSDDRKVIEMFTSKIQGGNFQQKLASLGQFVNNCDESCSDSKDVGEILANLVFLEALAAIIEDFNDKSGGFLFESLIVALAGGGAKQVDTVGGRYQDVTDIEVDGKPMSLKFLYCFFQSLQSGFHFNIILRHCCPTSRFCCLSSRCHFTINNSTTLFIKKGDPKIS